MSVINKLYEELLIEKLLVEESITVSAGDVKKVNLVDEPPQGGDGPGPDGPGPDGPQDDDETININDDPQPEGPQDGEPGDEGEGEGEGEGDEGDEGKGEGEGKETDEDWTEGGQQTLDSHDIFDDIMDKAGMSQEEKDKFHKDIEGETDKTVDRIQNRADRQKEANKKSKGHVEGGEGTPGAHGMGGEDSFFDTTINKIFKPKIDWSVFESKYNQVKTKNENRIKTYKQRSKSKLTRYLNKKVRKSRYTPELDYAKSLDTPTGRDPRSRVILKGEQYLDINIKPLYIIALDTSGSVGQKFFDIAGSEAQGLLNHINNKMGSAKDGVYFMSWAGGDSQINVRPFNGLYKKDFAIANYQGGTDPTSIFRYIENHMVYDRSSDIMKLNLMNIPDLRTFDYHFDNIIPIEDGEPTVMPFILIITDGYFGQMSQNSIKPYSGELNQNIWYLILDGPDDACFPKNIINFKNSKL